MRGSKRKAPPTPTPSEPSSPEGFTAAAYRDYNPSGEKLMLRLKLLFQMPLSINFFPTRLTLTAVY